MSDRPVKPPYNPHYFPEFDPPSPSPTFDDVIYAVLGRTRAENHLITIARDEFFSCWHTDERMAARLQAWSATIGLPEIVNDIAAFLDRVAERYGLSRRGDLGRISRPPHISVEDFLPEWYGLRDRLYAAYRRSPEVRDAACTYVCDELQQQWPWLAYRLTNRVFEQAWDRALGITPVRSRPSHLDDHIYGPYVQPFEYTLKTKPGELVAEAKTRFEAEYKAALTNLQPRESKWQSFPKGEVRPDRERKTRRNTKWLYLYLIGKVHGPKISIYSIAKLFHIEPEKRPKHKKFPKCSCQLDVRTGIKTVQALLDLTPWRF
jgi:hypothetical protein